MTHQISIIIPFLNEKEEVENTLKSIRKYSAEIPIILINDASNDGFDYARPAEEYKTHYIVNECRLGVAKSRDVGIYRCETEYFLLLDAHMRFYNSGWEEKICSILDQDKEVVICCQNRNLFKKNGKLYRSKFKGFGAKFLLFTESRKIFFPNRWLTKEKFINQDIEEIPMILGAAYASSKIYWIKLKGLDGLVQYGNDEIYISIKTWLSGGKCLLLKNVEIGHIYRNAFPYEINSENKLFNDIIIIKLLFPQKYFIYLSAIMKGMVHPAHYRLAHYKYLQHAKYLNSLKEYYYTIFIKDFNLIEEQNGLDAIFLRRLNTNQFDQLLFSLKTRLKNEDILGLRGKIGVILFLLLYNVILCDRKLSLFLIDILEKTLAQVNLQDKNSFLDGILGIGWVLEYLTQKGLLKSSREDLLIQIDERVTSTNILLIDDYSLDTGLLGILQYVVARISMRNIEHPKFTRNYVKLVYMIYSKNQVFFNSHIEIFNKLYAYVHGIYLCDQISISDVITYLNFTTNQDAQNPFNNLPFLEIIDLLNAKKMNL